MTSTQIRLAPTTAPATTAPATTAPVSRARFGRPHAAGTHPTGHAAVAAPSAASALVTRLGLWWDSFSRRGLDQTGQVLRAPHLQGGSDVHPYGTDRA